VRQPRLDDRGIQFAAKYEDGGDEIQKHQRDDHRGKTGIHRDVVIGEAREILAEHDARYQRRHHGEDDARQDLQKPAATGGKPGVQDEQRHDQRCDGDAVARKVEEILVGCHNQRNVASGRLQDQRAEHDQEGHCQRGECRDQGIADRFQPQPVPAPRLDHGVGAVERDAQGFDAVRGKIHREHRANSQHVAAGRRQHVVDFPRERVGDLLRPDLQQQPRRLIGEFLGTEKAGQRRQHDQKREQRHQRRQGDMAGDRPAVVGKKRVERILDDQIDVAKLPQHYTLIWGKTAQQANLSTF